MMVSEVVVSASMFQKPMRVTESEGRDGEREETTSGPHLIKELLAP